MSFRKKISLKKSVQENRQIWIDALRSGEYQQTKGYLNDENGFCCLGVLCDASTLGGWQVGHDGAKSFAVGGRYGSTITPPDRVIELVGISSDQANQLANANDGGKSFRQIANLIKGMKVSAPG